MLVKSKKKKNLLPEAPKWNNRNTVPLINYYKEKKLLWDPNDPNYRFVNCRRDAWNDIGTNFGLDGDSVKQKMDILLCMFRREQRKLFDLSSNSSDQSTFQPKWKYYQYFDFLKEFYTPKFKRLKANFSHLTPNVSS